MTYSEFAARGYATTARETGSEKQVELRVFSRITARIKAADTTQIGGFAELAEALHENVRLWNIIAIDMVDDGNLLPQELRAQILQLADFTRLHTVKVLNGTGDRETLVEINQAIMNGLAGIQPEEGVTEAA